MPLVPNSHLFLSLLSSLYALLLSYCLSKPCLVCRLLEHYLNLMHFRRQVLVQRYHLACQNDDSKFEARRGSGTYQKKDEDEQVYGLTKMWIL
jgi:hypothetical protein